jgi:Na+-driven multidrug efflux pump
MGWFTVFGVIFCLAAFIWAENIVRIFNKEPDMVAMAVDFLRIQIAGYVFMGLGAMVMNILNSVGDTLRAMIIDMANLWGVRIVLAYLLPRFTNLGVYSVRWAIVADALTSVIIFFIYFKTGRWKRKKV